MRSYTTQWDTIKKSNGSRPKEERSPKKGTAADRIMVDATGIFTAAAGIDRLDSLGYMTTV
jgi:hypothetical protein